MDVTLGLIVFAPILVLAVAATVRWSRFRAKHPKPTVQFFVSDLLLASLLIGVTVLAQQQLGNVFSQWAAGIRIAALSSVVAGLMCGKLFSLTTAATAAAPSSIPFLVAGALSGLALSAGAGIFAFICSVLWALTHFHGC